MVFESVVVEILNRFLGDYVENLDSKQLRIGIWGGDVVLSNLILKQTALEDLDLPIQTVYGRLGKLVLKIPWKNLYGAPVIAEIEGLFLLLSPNNEIKYDPVKEEKWAKEAKKSELLRIEEQKKKEAAKGQPKADDTFVEKLTTQIIKNVQLNIRKIHIRYEDKMTNPKRPFSFGITLSNLSVHTTDDNWEAAIITDAVSKIHKVLQLEGLAFYWNSDSKLYSNLAPSEIEQLFQEGIASKRQKPKDFFYVLGPINSSARLRMNPKPELDAFPFTIPKILLNLEMEKLSLGITKSQYQDITMLADSMGRMIRGKPFRKYRPFLNCYKGHYREWWKFAYKCILEEEVKRRRRNFNWDHIHRHRCLCREYAEVYHTKLTTKKIPTSIQQKINTCEDKLNVFNLVIIRQRIEMEVERLGKIAEEETRNKSWFSGWWGSQPSKDDNEHGAAAEIMKKFENAMTPAEKSKLYRAIDYEENIRPTEFPEKFVAMSCAFVLRALEVEVVNDDGKTVTRVLSTNLKGVNCRLEQRPAANALKVAMKIDEFTVFGVQQDNYRIPQIVTSRLPNMDIYLLDVLFETNPLDKRCTQRLHVTANPLQIVYDAQTIIDIVQVFKSPEAQALNQLQSTANVHVPNFKELKPASLEYALDKHAKLDLNINILASYVLVPYGGLYTGQESVLAVNLGRVTVTTLSRDSDLTDVRKMHQAGHTEDYILQNILTQSYEKFVLEITDVQVIITMSNENWQETLEMGKITYQHLLHPTNLRINLEKSLFTDDPRIPKLRVNGHLPSIGINITDDRLIHLIELFLSIPLPQGDVEPGLLEKSDKLSLSASALSLYRYLESEKTPDLKFRVSEEPVNLVQATDMEVRFEMKEFYLTVTKAPLIKKTGESSSVDIEPKRILKLDLLSLELEMVQQTFNMDVTVRLGGIGLNQYRDHDTLHIISTPRAAGEDSYLFTVTFTKVDRKSPEFHTQYGSCEQQVDMVFTNLGILLHQEGLCSLLQVTSDFQSQLESATEAQQKQKDRIVYAGDSVTKKPLATISEGVELATKVSLKPSKAKKGKRKVARIETILFKLNTELQIVHVEIANNVRSLMKMSIGGMTTDVIMKKSYTQIKVVLLEVSIQDPNPLSIHKNIISVIGHEAINVNVVMYNLGDKPTMDIETVEMSVDVQLGCLRVVFLNWFISSQLEFLNKFQAAQKAIIDASAAAAESAKANVQNAYKNATRIKMNIDFRAPDIIMPVNSTSLYGIFVDLGHLQLTNTLLPLDIKSDQGEIGIIDRLRMQLDSLKLSRIKFSENYDILRECVLLEPVSLIFIVKRNLSSSWCDSFPDIDLSGRLKTIKLVLTTEDYKMVMKVLSENMSEGAAQKSPPERRLHEGVPASTSAVSTRPNTLNVSNTVSETVSRIQEDDKKEEPKVGVVRTTVKFSFTMDRLVIDLYTGGAEDLSDQDAKISKHGLAQFSLNVLSVKGRMLADGMIYMSLLLLDCLLDDTRPGREGKLTRLLERSTDIEEEENSGQAVISENVKSMIDVTFKQQGRDMFVDVRVYSFNIILSMDYMMKLANFFTAAVTPPSEQPVVQKKIEPASTKSVSVTRQGSEEPSVPSTSSMTLQLRIEKPDIVLVESMDSIDTQALIMNNEIMVKVRMIGAHQVINGTIKDLTFFTCCYNPLKRNSTKYTVLRPVCISLAGSTPQGELNQGLHLDLTVSDIRLCVSPATLDLLSRVNETMLAAETEESDKTVVEEDHSNLWNADKFDETKFWFLRTEAAEDALSVFTNEDLTTSSKTPLNELCVLSAPSIIITMEAGVGNKTLPMILVETGLQASVHNWSSKMYVDATLTLQMGYYNSRLALWEPLIEPIETFDVYSGKLHRRPWELVLEFHKNEQEEPQLLSPISAEGESLEEIPMPQPASTITITSKANLELTVTKTCLEVLNNVGKAFSSAIKKHIVGQKDSVAPCLVKNETGLQITLMLERGAFQVLETHETEKPEEYTQVVLPTGTSVKLQVKPELDNDSNIIFHKKESSVNFQEDIPQRILPTKIDEFNCEFDLPVTFADKRFFSLKHRSDINDKWGIISDTIVQNGGTIVTLRSILQVHNHFDQPVDVYYMLTSGNEVRHISTVEPEGVCNVPVQAIYTNTGEIFFAVAGYTVSSEPFIWKDLQLNVFMDKLLKCTSKSASAAAESFCMKARGLMEQVYLEQTKRYTMASVCYHIHLRPACALRNCLPLPIIICLTGTAQEYTVQPGRMLHLPTVEPGKSHIVIRIPNYLDKEWSCRQEVPLNPAEFIVWAFDSFDSAHKVTMDLGIHMQNQKGFVIMSLYCPFWMLNKTGLMLAYRKSRKVEKYEAAGSPSKSSDESLNILHHPEDFKGPILFSFSSKNFFGKKKASIRVEQGEWSDKFSLDVAGSSGVVNCKVNDMIYRIGVNNQFTYNSLTKQVTFTPYYVLINNAPYLIEVQEHDRPAEKWIKVNPEECTAFWPTGKSENKYLVTKAGDTREQTVPFLITEPHNALLQLKNKYGGINVDVHVTEGSVYITFSEYKPGSAPALIINQTDELITFLEKESVNTRSLEPSHYVFYTWENPSGSRHLVWATGKKKEHELDLRKDGIGNSDLSKKTYWVSFLDGMQRVLLFTQDMGIARSAQSAGELEMIQQEVTVSFHGIGVSLVDNVEKKEIMYIGIASSGIIWETCKHHSKRYKPLSIRDCGLIEAAYQKYMQDLQFNVGSPPEPIMLLDPKLKVDFETEQLLKPHKRRLRRSFQTGLWFQIKTSPHQLQLHAKINRLQIDNQLYQCVFPVVLAPVPLPKSVAADNALKPFAELSIVQRIVKHSNIQQYKYFKLLIQEFHIKVDIGFVNALLGMFQAEEVSEKDTIELFEKDMNLVNEALLSHVETHSQQEQKSFYDMLHFSPLKIHVSFSLTSNDQNSDNSGSSSALPHFLSVLLQGLGVTLTDMQDVIFKLAYFEREYTFLTQQQLMSEAQSHYVGQAIKQLYVLVLGLDVLGNPFGLVLGITKGVEDLFYEPFQGAIQGPGEFAEGLVLGVRSLFGHTVGGAAGAVSRITGAMGKGIATLTFDKDYQRKRQNQLNKKPANFQEGIARSGKGLVMGVVDGVSGVFTKPISGAKEDGFEGFFKGLGKGAVGLVTRPTAGVIDFASGSLEAVKRAAELNEEVMRLRPPRFLQPDGLVRPYIRGQAEGFKLLTELEKGKYSSTDIYVYHCWVIEGKDLLLLTDKRVAYVMHNDLFGGWQAEWTYTWNEITHTPTASEQGIHLRVGEPKKKVLGLFGSSDSGKIIFISNPGHRDWLVAKMETLRIHYKAAYYE